MPDGVPDADGAVAKTVEALFRLGSIQTISGPTAVDWQLAAAWAGTWVSETESTPANKQAGPTAAASCAQSTATIYPPENKSVTDPSDPAAKFMAGGLGRRVWPR